MSAETLLNSQKLSQFLTISQVVARNNSEGGERGWGLIQKGYLLKYGKAGDGWVLVEPLQNILDRARERLTDGYDPNVIMIFCGVEYGTLDLIYEFLPKFSDHDNLVSRPVVPETGDWYNTEKGIWYNCWRRPRRRAPVLLEKNMDGKVKSESEVRREAKALFRKLSALNSVGGNSKITEDGVLIEYMKGLLLSGWDIRKDEDLDLDLTKPTSY